MVLSSHNNGLSCGLCASLYDVGVFWRNVSMDEIVLWCEVNHTEQLFTAPCCAAAVLAMALCPSVCPSVTRRCSAKMAKRRSTQTTPHDTPGTSFLTPKISAKFDRGHPLRGRQMQVGWVKIGDFRQIIGYISKTVQDKRMVSIKVK